MTLSIIVPVFNEAILIGSFLKHIRSVAPQAEIIVVDGGSSDDTKSIAQPLADALISASRGRAEQMNAGAAAAHGQVLWFLHVDLQVPTGSVLAIEKTLADPRLAGGCFRLRFPQPDLVYRVSDSLGNLGVELFGFALGDHGIFCRRTEFERIGGYPLVPILEDAELYRALRRHGKMLQLGQSVTSSPRAYLKYGPYRTTAVYLLILALYVFRFPIPWLHQIYLSWRKHRRPKLATERPTPYILASD